MGGGPGPSAMGVRAQADGIELRSKRTDKPLDPEAAAIRDRLSLATPRAIANLERLMAL